ncbi:MAG: four helix bundle suffix domain-containing protein [Prevotella sp.]|jgi:four helix bundle suffix protein
MNQDRGPHEEKTGEAAVLLSGNDWRRLYFYQKTDTLYQLTYIFCKRFLPKYGDRTVDQMVQAARSGKQNIVEGIEDGRSSTEMQLRLINVARSSLQELREDYQDYLNTRQLTLWNSAHPRYDGMLRFCRQHNGFEQYAALAERWTDEVFCNTAITLCHMTDKMLCSYLNRLQKEFVEHGGIKERMYAARTGYRKEQDKRLQTMQAANTRMKQENDALRAEVEMLKAEVAALQAKLKERGL